MTAIGGELKKYNLTLNVHLDLSNKELFPLTNVGYIFVSGACFGWSGWPDADGGAKINPQNAPQQFVRITENGVLNFTLVIPREEAETPKTISDGLRFVPCPSSTKDFTWNDPFSTVNTDVNLAVEFKDGIAGTYQEKALNKSHEYDLYVTPDYNKLKDDGSGVDGVHFTSVASVKNNFAYKVKFRVKGVKPNQEFFIGGADFGWDRAWPFDGWGGGYKKSQDMNKKFGGFMTTDANGNGTFDATLVKAGATEGKAAELGELQIIECVPGTGADAGKMTAGTTYKFAKDNGNQVKYEVKKGTVWVTVSKGKGNGVWSVE